MDKHSIIICILLGIITTNLIRVVPMLLIKGQITNRFLRSFLYYVPYVTLAVMTFPSMIQTTLSPLSGTVALIVGIIAALPRRRHLLRHRLSDGQPDPLTDLFQILAVCIIESGQPLAVNVKHGHHLAVVTKHGNNDFRTRLAATGDMPRELLNVGHDDRLCPLFVCKGTPFLLYNHKDTLSFF